MNQFHIYEPIGRGKHSVVYKGRKKRSVEYVAIKSTDRNQKPRVLQEVKVMHAVKHPNVLRFYAWYETTNHLWLILEYCVGGDLRTLLRADKQLPEATVLRFARDVAAALQYLHSTDTLHCDLNPSNLLLDENGRVKLGGFSRSRRAGDGQALMGSAVPQGQASGSMPYYSAPEVLQEGGQPSAASDLWSLGCIIYECAAGRPPFLASTLSSLTSLVQSADPVPLIGVSPEFQNLVSRLLDRDPSSRLTWAELCAHPFWGASPLEELSVPDAISAPRSPKHAGELQAVSQPSSSGSSSSSGGNQQPQQPLGQKGGEAEDSDVSPPRTHVRHLSSDEGVPEEDHAPGPDAGATPLHPSSRARAPEQPPAGDAWQAAAAAQQQQRQPPGAEGAGAGSSGHQVGRPGSLDLEALVWHPTDATMKPIVGNKRIERPMEAAYAPALLPFQPVPAQELHSYPASARSSLWLTLSRVLAGSAHQHTKLALLCYMEALAADATLAHELINSDLCLHMVRMLQAPLIAALRARIANVIGLLIRHTSVIQASLAEAGLVEALAGGLRDDDLEVQRRSTAALGELLFYVASQQRDPRSASAGAAGSSGGGSGGGGGNGGPQGGWQVSPEVVEELLGTLGGGRDEVVQHYVVKTIENIAGQAGAWAHKFATPEVVATLTQVVGGTGSDSLRGTAASAVCRLLRCKPSLLPRFLDQAGMGFIANGMRDSSPRVQQAATTMLCMLCSAPGSSQRALQAADAEQTLLPALGVILEHTADVLKGKGVVAAALLCRGGPVLLCALCTQGVLQRAEKAGREQSQFVGAAVTALRGELAAAFPALLSQIANSLRSRQHGTSAGASLPQMPTLLYLLGSPSFRDVVVSGALIASLADILTRAISSASTWAGHQDVKGDVLQAIDRVCSHPELLMQHHEPVLSQLLPALSAAVASSKESSDNRFVCLKLLCDIVLQSVTEPGLYYPDGEGGNGSAAEAQGLGAASELINAAVSQYVLPLTPALLADEDPMPLYALKMLGVLLDVNPAWVLPLAELGIARRFFEWMSIDHPHNNVHNIRLCRLIVQSEVLPPAQLLDLQVVDRVLAVLSYAHEMDVEPFLEPSLELCLVLMEAFSRQPAGAAETGKLLPALPLLLALCLHRDTAVAAAAAACLAGTTQLHPEDAAAILAANDGFSIMAGVLQPSEEAGLPGGAAVPGSGGGGGMGGGGLNEEAAYHLVHAAALAAHYPALQRRRDALEQLAAAVRRVAQCAASGSLKQAAAEALAVLGQAAAAPGPGRVGYA